ncbi:hypothetical protein [Fibrella forsythiae]|uniref:Uncharacterized protein n=1 Tax=Fibrella forsythiae TaxID=2817061 RepID=A0ABS3JJW0_9BACT|nr:hypothetical protein [Fibrella forsythiae]MBO0950290.1 hypothetical protein [Fibrella forsythiae]
MPVYESNIPRTTGNADFDGPPADISIDRINYWGNHPEAFFGITFDRLLGLRNGSPTGHVALRVRSLTSPRYASAVWLPFDDGNHPQNAFHYFVLTSAQVDALTSPGNGQPPNALLALLRKDIHHNIYIMFKPMIIGGGVGGENDTTGTRIPAPRG